MIGISRSIRWQANGAAVQIDVTFVAGVDGYGGVTEHGLGSRGSDDEEAVRHSDDGVADVPEMAGGFLVRGFEIGDGGVAAGAPVDHVLAAVDESFFVEADEDFADGAGEAGVECEALAGPVAGGADADHLAFDGAAGFGFPLPDALFEGFASHGAAVEAFGGELAFDDHLGGDAGVVGAGEPEGDVAAHAMPADGDVDFGVLEHVAHVERAGDIGRGDDEREEIAAGLEFGVVDAALDPPLSPAGLEAPGLVDLF